LAVTVSWGHHVELLKKKRQNIPTAEYQSVLKPEEQKSTESWGWPPRFLI